MAPFFLHPPFRRPVLWAVILTALGLFFWFGFSRATQLETVLNDGTLRVVILEDPRHINVGQDRFATALTDAFAQDLGVDLSIQTAPDLTELTRTLELGFADMAAGGLIARDDALRMRYSDPFFQVQPQVVSLISRPIEAGDLATRQGVIREDAPLARALSDQLPATANRIDGTTEDVLQALVDGEADYAIIDSSDYAYYRPYFPNLRHRFDLADGLPVSWAFIQHRDDSVIQAANGFLSGLAESGRLEIIRDRYFGHLQEFDYVGIQLFDRHVRERLPALRNAFETAGQKTGVDWRLLAAQAYQESHWRPNAVSPTGVRGIMMLTLPTAGDLGITNRLDPQQSIDGGSRYLADLIERVPEQITEPDRTWYALAAYNLGLGHVRDGMRIAEALDMDPNNWATMQDILPRLRDPEYYRFTRFGYARGDEAVIYVQNIRRYYDLMRWIFPTDEEFEGNMPGLQPESPDFPLPSLI